MLKADTPRHYSCSKIVSLTRTQVPFPSSLSIEHFPPSSLVPVRCQHFFARQPVDQASKHETEVHASR